MTATCNCERWQQCDKCRPHPTISDIRTILYEATGRLTTANARLAELDTTLGQHRVAFVQPETRVETHRDILLRAAVHDLLHLLSNATVTYALDDMATAEAITKQIRKYLADGPIQGQRTNYGLSA